MVLKEDDFIVVAEFKFSKINEKNNLPIKSFDMILKEVINQINIRNTMKNTLTKK